MKYHLKLILLILLSLKCDWNHGLEPARSGIQGTITYIGTWPAEAAEVTLVATNKFPPTELSDLIIGESLPVSGDTYDYTFYLKPGTYKIVGLAWRAKNSVWDISSICGLYFSGTDSLIPGEVIIPSNRSIIKNINIGVNRSKARTVTDTRITGSISFEGEWPSNIEQAIVIATTKDPFSPNLSLLDLSFSNSIPRDVRSANYIITASPGIYHAVGVLFLKANQSLSIEDLYFTQNIGGLVIDEFTVSENDTIQGPDFVVSIGPINSGIKGQIHFKGQWPAPVAELRLVAAKNFPPSFTDLIIGPALPFDEATYDYTFNLSPDEYSLIGVIWRENEATWDLLSICGIYFSGADSLSPGEITIADYNTIIDEIDIVVNRSHAHRITDTKIQGSLQFSGTWPASITEARVIATTKFAIVSIIPPVFTLPTLLDLCFGDRIEAGVTSADYSINAFPGNFAATGILFFKTGQTITMDDIYYSLGVGGLNLTPYEVLEDSVVAGPDFQVKF